MSDSNAPSPVPPPGAAAAAAAASAGDAAEDEDWRASVQQSYRNNEVREIAKVLAALEPGVASTASKLRLAMQFEDAVFKSATSPADYRKRLTKRLKKVQKSYVPAAAPDQRELVERQLLELRQRYGSSLRYVLQNADAAMEIMGQKHGADKAAQLRQHTDGVRAWAADLGVSADDTSSAAGATATAAANATARSSTQMSQDQLDKLRGHLERRLENIRSHVVKLADPDTFLLETLQKTEADLQSEASRILAGNTTRRYEQLTRRQKGGVDARSLFDDAWAGIGRPVPLLTRREQDTTGQAQTDAGLIQLSKMRAASTLLLGWMMTPDKATLPGPGGANGKNVLQKAHATANEGTKFVCDLLKRRREANGENDDAAAPKIKLEDAWMKSLELPPTTTTATVDSLGDQQQSQPSSSSLTSTDPPESKRPRTSRSRPACIRTRVLLTPNRKPPSNLLPALRRKRAVLVRPPPTGEGSHLVLEFGTAFVLTIYLSPLAVTLRAYNKKTAIKRKTDEGSETITTTTTTTTSDATTMLGSWCATMTPLSDGLTNDDDDDVEDGGDNGGEPELLSVWGVTGTYSQLGRVVEERLRDASAAATYVLRQCFERSVYSKLSETAHAFEVEIREATALLEFIQLARTTYVPDWQDDD